MWCAGHVVGSFWHVCTCPVGRAVVALSTPGVVGGRPEWRGEACRRCGCFCGTRYVPRCRGVCGCICCAPACLLFLHFCVYLEFSVSSASDKDAGSAALCVRRGRGQRLSDAEDTENSSSAALPASLQISVPTSHPCFDGAPRALSEATTSFTNHADLPDVACRSSAVAGTSS